MIKIENLNKDYYIKNGIVHALNNINIDFPNSGFYSIIGKSGAGKTTLLNCMAGIDKSTSGSILYNNIDITKLKNNKLDDYREEISFIFQDYNLLTDYSVEENIALSVKIQGMSNQESHKIVLESLEKVGLSGYENRKIIELSGGEQQRVVIARALAKNSKVIFCDEPTGNLDESTARNLFDLLKKISNDILIIVVTHNNILAKDYSDGIIELNDGNIINNTISINNQNDIIKTNIKKRLNLSFYLKLCLEQIKTLKFFSLLILGLFTCSFIIFTILTAISSFNKTEALINTLKNNNQTVLNLKMYTDYVEEITTDTGVEYDYGVVTGLLQDAEKETPKLKEIINDKANVYNSYMYIRSFNSLFGIEYPEEITSAMSDHTFNYHSFYFNQMIAVDDFNNFSLNLLYGRMPQNKNEILIYDYMASNILYYHVYNGTIKDIVGKKIKDDTQKIELTISGIIKSNYQEYDYTDNISRYSDTIAMMYLNSLKSIYVSKDLINLIEKNYKSIDNVALVKINEDDEIRINFDQFKTITYTMEEYDYIIKGKRGHGLILTLSQVQTFLGLDRTPSNSELEDFVENFDSYGNHWYIDYFTGYWDTYNTLYKSFFNSLYGIVDDSVFNNNSVLHCYGTSSQKDGAITQNVYLSLNKDYSNAKEVLEILELPSHSENYFIDCIRNKNFYKKVGFCVYDSSQILIDEASDFLYKISDITKPYVIFSYVLIVVGIISFCLLSIKKQSYKIGILKSLGAKNIQIGISFVISIAIIAIIAYIISIPCSFIYMKSLNTRFINEVENINLILFSIEWKGLLIPLLITIGITFFTSIVTYIVFTINPPVILIRKNKER